MRTNLEHGAVDACPVLYGLGQTHGYQGDQVTDEPRRWRTCMHQVTDHMPVLTVAVAVAVAGKFR